MNRVRVIPPFRRRSNASQLESFDLKSTLVLESFNIPWCHLFPHDNSYLITFNLEFIDCCYKYIVAMSCSIASHNNGKHMLMKKMDT